MGNGVRVRVRVWVSVVLYGQGKFGTFALMPRGWISRLKNAMTFKFAYDLHVAVF